MHAVLAVAYILLADCICNLLYLAADPDAVSGQIQFLKWGKLGFVEGSDTFLRFSLKFTCKKVRFYLLFDPI